MKQHPSWQPSKPYPHDVALVRLRHPARVSGAIRPVCLPAPGVLRELELLGSSLASAAEDVDFGVGTSGVVIGWGRTHYDQEGHLQVSRLLSGGGCCLDSQSDRQHIFAQFGKSSRQCGSFLDHHGSYTNIKIGNFIDISGCFLSLYEGRWRNPRFSFRTTHGRRRGGFDALP